MSDTVVDNSSEMNNKDLKKKKKEIVEEAENWRDVSAHGNAIEENGEQETDNEVNEEEKEGKRMRRRRTGMVKKDEEMRRRGLRQL